MAGHTEKEAAQLWCPHMRKAIVDINGGLFPGNMSADRTFFPATSCIGSRCMQWRWLDSETATLDYSIDARPDASLSEVADAFQQDEQFKKLCSLGWSPSHDFPVPTAFSRTGRWTYRMERATGDERRGFCGLAGRP